MALLAVATSGGFSHAQNVNSAKTGSVGLTTRLQYDTNPNLAVSGGSAEFTASERLSFSVLTETRNQQFSASGGAAASYTTGGTGFALVRPDIQLDYSTDTVSSDFGARFAYQEVDVNGTYDIDPSTAVILVSDPGTVRTLAGGASVNLGKNGPLSFSGDVAYRQTEVLNTLDPSLFDTQNLSLSGASQLTFSPVTTATVSVNHNRYSADDATQTRTNTTTADVSATTEIKSALTLSANAGYLRRDLTLNGTTNTRTGFKVGVGLDQAYRSGNVFGRLSYDDTGPSSRTSLTVGGAQQLPAGNLTASITAASVQGGSGLKWTGNAGYTQQLSDGAISFNVNQAYQTDQNDNETLSTRFGLGFQQSVTANSNLSVNLNYARIEDAGNGSQPTQNRATLGAAYDRALTPDWNMSVGYTHRLYSDTNGTANSDSVFLSLSRNVQFSF